MKLATAAFFLSVLVLEAGAVIGRAGENTKHDLLIADFEGETYGAWKANGEAFGPGPARGTLRNQKPVTGFLGKGLVNSYLGGDKSKGTLTSPEFNIQRPYINFLIGGGYQPGQACVNLVVGGRTVRTATGRSQTGEDTEALEPAHWDVGELAGKTAHLEIVDQATGGWGHINVDHVVQSSVAKGELAVTPVISVDELYNETYRPQFHFTPKRNWTNDPNGLVFYQGEYHLFFQHNPTGIDWGNMTWGHAVSKDLVHWEQLANAIEPDRLGTIFSGSAVVDSNNTAGFQTGSEKTIVAIYTSAGGTSAESKGQPFTQSLAYSNDRGRTWKKYEKNPVIPHLAGQNRDPKVVWHEPTKRWIMVLFLDKSDYAFFSSPDLKTWTKLHEITVPGSGECPDFFEMPIEGQKDAKKWVFTSAKGDYLVGDFDGRKFSPETGPHPLRWGGRYYAVQSYSDIPASDGRRVQIAWMAGAKYPGMPFNQQMNFPSALTLRRLPEGLRLYRYPVREVEVLRTKTHTWADKTLAPGETLLGDLRGELYDIEAEIEPANAREVMFGVSGQKITWRAADKKLLAADAKMDLPAENGRIRLRILVDRVTIDAFGNDGRVAVSYSFLPKPGGKPLELTATGGAAKIVTLRVHELKSAWRRKGA